MSALTWQTTLVADETALRRPRRHYTGVSMAVNEGLDYRYAVRSLEQSR